MSIVTPRADIPHLSDGETEMTNPEMSKTYRRLHQALGGSTGRWQKYAHAFRWEEFDEYMERRCVYPQQVDNAWIDTLIGLCTEKMVEEPLYDRLGVSILMDVHDKNTPSDFVKAMEVLQENKDVHGSPRPLLDQTFYQFILDNQTWIRQMQTKFDTRSDEEEYLTPSIFGWKTLYKSYLMKSNGKVVERWIHLWMRVALFLWRERASAERTLLHFLKGRGTHATPTLFYAGAVRPQMASCFVAGTIVLTDEGPERIEDVALGRKVLTHTGAWRTVEQRHVKPIGNRELLRLYLARTTPLVVTADHRFFVLSADKNKPDWKCAGDLREGDAVMISSPTVKYLPSLTAPRSGGDPLTNWFRLAGAWWGAEGGYDFDSDNNNVPVALSLGDVLLDSELLPLTTDPGVVHWFVATFGLGSKRFMDARWWTQLPVQLVLTFLHEYETFSPVGKCAHKDVYLLGRAYGVDTISPEAEDHIGIETVAVGLHKYVPWLKTERVSAQPEQYVYTLGVEEDHSYAVEGVIAQNCFLVGTEDSVYNIFKTLGDVAQISKWAGGVGIHISNIRADRAYICGTNGYSNGILPMIRLYNDTSRYIDQCFSGNTRVLTLLHGWKKIQDIEPRDCVLTLEGVFRPVARVRQYLYSGPLYGAQSGAEKIWVTEGHDMAVYTSDSRSDIEFVSVDAFHAGTEIVFSVPRDDALQEEQNGAILETDLMTHLFVKLMGLAITETVPSPEKEEVNWTQYPRMAQLTEMESMLAIQLRSAWFHPVPSLPRQLWWAPITKRMVWLYSSLLPLDNVRPIQYFDIWKYRFGHSMWPWSDIRLDDRKTEMRAVRAGNLLTEKMQAKEIPVFDLELQKEETDTANDAKQSFLTELGVAHNGGGKRNGAFAIYAEPWHADIIEFLQAKRNTGPEEARARDLFYGLWIPDLFMKRIQRDELWSLMCPSVSPHLHEKWGHEFEDLYLQYEREGKFTRQLPARELWLEILKSQMETGTPYLLYKDACNRKSNQKNLGTIRSSNLCVAADTRILTKEHHWVPIADCVGQAVHVWNGKAFSLVKPIQTGTTTAWVHITFSHGTSLRCTPEHKFFVIDDEAVREVTAKELRPGMQLESFDLPVHGMKDLSPALCTSTRVGLDFLRAKRLITQSQVFIWGQRYDSLVDLLLLLQSLGTVSSIVPSPLAPNSFALMFSRDDWERTLSRWGCTDDSILSPIALANTDDTPSTVHGIKVESVTTRLCSEEEECYCFTEPYRHRGTFEGVVCGNCTEIIEYSDDKEYAVCNLASVALPKCLVQPSIEKAQNVLFGIVSKPGCFYCDLLMGYLSEHKIPYALLMEAPPESIKTIAKTYPMVFTKDASCLTTAPWTYVGGFRETFDRFFQPRFDHQQLYDVTYQWVLNLNQVIDKNVYPVPETEWSNRRHRPIGLGVQGLADVFCAMKWSFDEAPARMLNRHIFETMYFAALTASCDLAKQYGPYGSFVHSPLSHGQFHFDLCDDYDPNIHSSKMWDWDALRHDISQYGVYNSLLIAPMPTASTSQILGNNECFEPYTSNLYLRRTLVGEFYIANPWMLRDLQRAKRWSPAMRQRLLLSRGSVAGFTDLPAEVRSWYRTVWEIPQRHLLEMAHDRHFFIDQSQSMNLFVENPTPEKLTRMHFFAWSKGLKTGCYYLRTRAAVSSIAVAVESVPSSARQEPAEEEGCMSCSA